MKTLDKWLRPLQLILLASLVNMAIWLLYVTLRIRLEQEAIIQRLCQEQGAVILVTWHGSSLIPIAHGRGRGYTGLVSLSRDGDFLVALFRQMRWRAIRGSTGRGGMRAMKTALAAMQTPGTVLAITPDGPRGPRGKVQPGAVYLAQKSGKPIVPVGIGVASAWYAKSWDAFCIPKPFTSILCLFGEPIFVGPNDDVEHVALQVEQAINALNEQTMRRVQRSEAHAT